MPSWRGWGHFFMTSSKILTATVSVCNPCNGHHMNTTKYGSIISTLFTLLNLYCILTLKDVLQTEYVCLCEQTKSPNDGSAC